jgi:hypothetical protein
MIEAACPSILFTLLRVCDSFGFTPSLYAGLDHHLRKRRALRFWLSQLPGNQRLCYFLHAAIPAVKPEALPLAHFGLFRPSPGSVNLDFSVAQRPQNLRIAIF